MRPTALLVLTVATLGLAQAPEPAGARADPNLAAALGFELAPRGSQPDGWGGNPLATISSDETVKHSGQRAARIERSAASDGAYTSITKALPLDFSGREIELRGFARTEEVSGTIAIWMRQDGSQPGLDFATSEDEHVQGTTDWKEYSIRFPVNPDARTLKFGFVLQGTGRAWVDDLKLLVDGKPVWEAPPANRVPTALEQDHEFDAGSGIAVTTLTPVQVANLALLGRVWGFLKYHHPRIRAGKVHWDYELFRVMPGILAAADRIAAQAALVRWVEALGEVKPVATAARLKEDGLYLPPGNDWLGDEAALGSELSRRLRQIHANRPAGTRQFYVSLAPGVGNPVFEQEPAYPGIKSPDAGYQLLALFRFWNIVHYWFPYRDLIGEDWDAVLAEYVPRLARAGTADAYQLEMVTLIARVHDTHANLWSSLQVLPPAGDSQVPVAVRFVGNAAVIAEILAVPDGPAQPLQRGDIIEAIDGVPVAELVKTWTPYYAASNEPKRRYDIAQALTRGPAGDVQLAVRRAGETLTVTAQRLPVKQLAGLIKRTHDLPGEAFQLLSKDVAYLKLSAVRGVDLKDCIARAAGTKGLIIDIRNYPSAFVVFTLGQLLVDKPTEFVRFTVGNLETPGAFHFTPALKLEPAQPRYAGRVVILVDEVSLSQSEYTTMAFRAAPGAIVVGSTTAGADGNVSRIPLPGGLETMISGIGIFYPDNRPTQRVGIIPDVEAKPSIEGLRAGRDEVLEAGLQQVLGPEAPAEEIQAIVRGAQAPRQ